ncbi:hypothetical protein [Streptomyces sp. NPDC057386]|uniref:hypothetical protein n=1 Tax=unclassified Streptomyces TaxID=2593676 RepID=UPI0036414134
MTTQMRRLAVAAALLCCCALTSCGTERADGRAGAGDGGGAVTAASPTAPRPSASASGASGASGASCDVSAPGSADETSEGGAELPDATSEDSAELPDTTSEDATDLPDTTSEGHGPTPVDTEEDADLSDRWYSMTGDFTTYLKSSPSKADAALAGRVRSASVCTTQGGARTLARVRVDLDVREDEPLNRTARVFARWRQSQYGDHGHVEVLAPARMSAELDW